jgi:hypothetical protein
MRFIIYGNVREQDRSAIENTSTLEILQGLLNEGRVPPDLERQPAIMAELERLRIISRRPRTWSIGPCIVSVTAHIEDELLGMAATSARKYSEVVSDNVDSLRQCVRMAMPDLLNRFDWQALTPVIIGAFFLDMAVGHELYRGRIDPNSFWVLCYNTISSPGAEAGVRLTVSEDGHAALGIFWSPRLSNEDQFFHPEDVGILHDILRNRLDCCKSAPRLLKLCYQHILNRSERGYLLAIPYFEIRRQAELTAMISSMARRIVLQIIEPDLRLVQKLVEDVPQTSSSIYLLFYNRLLLECGFEMLLQSGLIHLPTVKGVPCPGAWLWLREDGEEFPFLGDEYA